MQIINTSLACCWTYVDLFIIQISMYLSTRFKQIGKTVKRMSLNNIKSVKAWRTVREDYMDLCRICSRINNNIANLIFIAFFTNIYFIIVGLFFGISTTRSPIQFYFVLFTFSLLVLRSASVCWLGGCVNEESKEFLQFLVASKVDNIEVIF